MGGCVRQGIFPFWGLVGLPCLAVLLLWIVGFAAFGGEVEQGVEGTVGDGSSY